MLFNHTIATLPPSVASLVFDIVDDAPEDLCYDLIKRAVISRQSVSQDRPLSAHQPDLDKLSEVADRIHNLHDRPGINAVKTSAFVITTSQQPGIITKHLEKL
nr:hypothetical transcript [Hymenolepis microstoma]